MQALRVQATHVTQLRRLEAIQMANLSILSMTVTKKARLVWRKERTTMTHELSQNIILDFFEGHDHKLMPKGSAQNTFIFR